MVEPLPGTDEPGRHALIRGPLQQQRRRYGRHVTDVSGLPIPIITIGLPTLVRFNDRLYVGRPLQGNQVTVSVEVRELARAVPRLVYQQRFRRHPIPRWVR